MRQFDQEMKGFGVFDLLRGLQIRRGPGLIGELVERTRLARGLDERGCRADDRLLALGFRDSRLLRENTSGAASFAASEVRIRTTLRSLAGMVQARKVSYRSLAGVVPSCRNNWTKTSSIGGSPPEYAGASTNRAQRLQTIGPEPSADELSGDALKLLLAQKERIIAAVADRVLFHGIKVGIKPLAASRGVSQLKLATGEHQH